MVRLLRFPPSRSDPPSHSRHLSSHATPGAGPFEVDVSPDDGATFQPAVVTKDVPGERSRSDAEATDFEMVAQVRTLSSLGVPSTDEFWFRSWTMADASGYEVCWRSGWERVYRSSEEWSSSRRESSICLALLLVAGLLICFFFVQPFGGVRPFFRCRSRDSSDLSRSLFSADSSSKPLERSLDSLNDFFFVLSLTGRVGHLPSFYAQTGLASVPVSSTSSACCVNSAPSPVLK